MNKILPILPAALLLLVTASGSTAAEPENEIYGDWAVRCVERQELPPCDIVQFAQNLESNTQVMQFSVAHAGREASYGVQIVVPLGVLLLQGVAIRVDEGPVLTDYNFTRCNEAGCFIERMATDEILEPFKAGQAGVLVVIDSDGQPLSIPLSFQGFTQALKVMTERNREWADSF